MCGRVIIPHSKQIEKDLNVKVHEPIEYEENINVAPTLNVPVIADQRPNDLLYMRWSMLRGNDYSTFNATIEKLNLGLWADYTGKSHCIIVTSGFYEWNYDDPIKKKGSHPHIIKTRGEKYTFMAGLWTEWKEGDNVSYSCSVITQPANDMMAKIHNTKGRMPAILTPDQYKLWLDPELPASERMKAIVRYDDDFLEAKEIKKVGDIDEFRTIGFC